MTHLKTASYFRQTLDSNSCTGWIVFRDISRPLQTNETTILQIIIIAVIITPLPPKRIIEMPNLYA